MVAEGPAKHIYFREMAAMVAAMMLAPPFTAIFVDAKVVIGSLRRSRRPNWLLYKAAEVHLAKALIVEWIALDLNPADFYTRHPCL